MAQCEVLLQPMSATTTAAITVTATSAAAASAAVTQAEVTKAVTTNSACWLHSAMLGVAWSPVEPEVRPSSASD